MRTEPDEIPSERPELDDVIREAVRIIRPVALKSGRLRDDVVQAARIGAWKAWQRWDEANAASFTQYLRKRVFGSVIDEMRANYPAGLRKTKLGMPHHEAVGEFIEDHLEVGWEIESEDGVRELLKVLPHPYLDAVTLYYLHAKSGSLRLIAEDLGVSESAVCLWRQKAFDIIRGRGFDR